MVTEMFVIIVHRHISICDIVKERMTSDRLAYDIRCLFSIEARRMDSSRAYTTVAIEFDIAFQVSTKY